MNELISKASKIKCLICDLDGVLTDGLLYIDSHGGELKTFHVQDGMGLKLLMAAGIQVAVITTSATPVVAYRMQQLGINYYYTGQIDKRSAFTKLKATLGFDDSEFAYVGDDLPDLAIMQQVGLGIAVANAVAQVKEFAFWQTELEGGKGAVREVCELILTAQNKQNMALANYIRG